MSEWNAEAVRDAIARELRGLPAEVQDVRLDGDSVRWPVDPRDPRDPGETPATYASEARWNLQELIEAEGHGLPEGRVGELTWVG